MTQKDIAVKFTQIEGQIEALNRHEKKFDSRLDSIDLSILTLSSNVNKVLSEIRGVPEKVREMELEKAKNDSYINNFVKPFFIFFIGMVSTYVFQNVIFANREQKSYNKTEVKK
jgi:hypothetical protein